MSSRHSKHHHDRRDRSRDRERDRSRSPRRRSRGRNRSVGRDRSASPDRKAELPLGVKPISEDDYFQKSDEFRLWLKDEKRKYFDELSGDKARSYFRKFVKAWNRCKLPNKYYEGITPGTLAATTNTSFKWGFASKASKAETSALRAARVEVGAATYKVSVDDIEPDMDNEDSQSGPSARGGGRVQGPARPSASDLTLANELLASQRAEDGKYKHAKNKRETKERIEEIVGPKEGGREGRLENQKVKRENDRDFRESRGGRGDEGLEVDESTLMGGSDSFKAMIARRDMAKKKYQQKNEEKYSEFQERAVMMKDKEKATMDMFQQLAKQRFG
ncbi:hypothetical protein CPB83DRAFT_854889 [Crepidotus variabilis]|uniref:Uncharacterized protein n=1 Tax=Crepidotus variabilis TaxID=179855 RepID=A0A9P6JP46_9AGAR|nr:hypothetical protein CPB83DRAFT_854889 [Crepidotus variabilis]